MRPWLEKLEQQPALARNIRFGLLALGLALALLAVVRGQLFFPDEYRYFWPLNLEDSLWDQDYHRFLQLIEDLSIRLGYFLVYWPVMELQQLAAGGGYVVDPLSGWAYLARAFWVPAAFQVLVYLLNAFLVFQITRKLFYHPVVAILAMGFYLLWPPNLIYTRHLLPPLTAETFLLMAALWFIKAYSAPAGERKKELRISGSFYLVQFLVYPGFYYTALGFLLCLLIQRATPRLKIENLVDFLLPTALGVLILEVLARLVFDFSYLADLIAFSTTVSQGDADLGLPFVAAYYVAVAPLFVLLALAAMVWGLVLAERFFAGRRSDANDVNFAYLSLIALAGYIWLLIGYTLVQHMVLYARILLPMSLIMMIQAAYLVFRLLKAPVMSRQLAGGAVAVLAIISLGWGLADFYAVRYPADLHRTLAAATGMKPDPGFMHSSRNPDYNLDVTDVNGKARVAFTRTAMVRETIAQPLTCSALSELGDKKRKPGPEPDLFLVLNRSFIYPIAIINAMVEEEIYRGELLFDAPHPFHYRPYQFEGLDREDRQLLNLYPLRMQIVRNPCPEMQTVQGKSPADDTQ